MLPLQRLLVIWMIVLKIERVLLTEQGVVPLYQPAEAWMVRPTVKNVVYNGAGANYNFKYAYVEK